MRSKVSLKTDTKIQQKKRAIKIKHVLSNGYIVKMKLKKK